MTPERPETRARRRRACGASYSVGSLVSRTDPLLARIREALGRIDPRTQWPHGLVRLGVAACVVVSAAFGLVYFVKAVDRLGRDASEHAATTFDDREFGAGNGLGVDKAALYEARASIPEGEKYRVVVGPSVPASLPIAAYALYFLMPRRPDPDAHWILCYRCRLPSLGDEFRVVWRNDAGNAVGRLPG